MEPGHIRNHTWKPALLKAGLDYRPMKQTRYTFATIAIDSGEDLGWVQQMVGHSSLQMYTMYYRWVKSTRNDGSAFEASFKRGPQKKKSPKPAIQIIKLVPNKKGVTSKKTL